MSYGYTEHLCEDCGDRFVTDYQKSKGHTYLDVVVEATEESLGYTRHLCIVCNYSYLSDFVTSGDTGYIEEEEPKPVHKHAYELEVQDFGADKYFIALRVCICGDSKVGDMNITLTNADGEEVELSANEYGQVDYAALYGDWLVTITDETGEQLALFDISAGEAPEQPADPDDGNVPTEPETPVDPDDGDEVETPDDGNTDEPSDPETPENPDDGDDTQQPEVPDKEKGGNAGTAIALLIVFVLLVAGGIGAVIFLKKRKKKNQN